VTGGVPPYEDSVSEAATQPVSAPLGAPSPTVEAGTIVSRYIALEQIGRGGMGRVLRA
jgi:hypothetical protein